MSTNEWAGLVLTVMTIIGTFAGFTRWLVKTFFYQLIPNGGSSMRDDVTKNTERLERVEQKTDKQSERIDDIYRLLLESKSK